MTRFGSVIVCAIALLASAALRAQAADFYDYRVLLDTDRNPSTGCGVAVKDANIDTTVNGIDQLVIIHVERTSQFAAQVIGVGLQVCAGGSFGAETAVAPGSWPVGLNDGLNGADVVEGFAPRNALGNPDGTAQVAVSSTKTGHSDVLLTRNGQPSGGALFFNFLHASPAPAMAPWSVGAAVLLMGLIAYAGLRRRSRVVRLGVVALILVIGGIVVAQVATITPDGAVDDWATIKPIGMDQIHDTSTGDDAEDIVAAFMAQDNDNAYFRVDLLNVIDPAPTRTSTPASTPTNTSMSVPMAPTSTSTPTAQSTPTATPTPPSTSTETSTTTPTATPSITPTATPVDCSTAADGTSCNDGNGCSTTDTCQAGVCKGANFVICPPNIGPPPQCETGTFVCDPATGHCVPQPVTDGTTCDDGNACSTGDTCQAGVCTGASFVICPPSLLPSQCTLTTNDCNPATGLCVPRPVLDGTACNDGDACTSSDSCQAGMCKGTSCAAEGKVCCSQQTGCVDLGSDSANCGACGTACMNSACLGGKCYDGCVINGVGYPNGTADPANPCQQCDISKTRTGWTINNNNICNVGCFTELCQNGQCDALSLGSGSCPSTTCGTGSCQNDGCVLTPKNEGAACTPPSAIGGCQATTGTCQSGQCVANGANEGGSCQDASNDCTTITGTCNSGKCVTSNLPNGTACHGIGGNCNIGSCSNGQCVSHLVLCPMLPAACGNSPGSCNPSNGQCVYPTPVGGYPSHGTILCQSDIFGFDPDPSKCCPGQLCICHPDPVAGIPGFCISPHECWNPADIPTPGP